MKINLHDNDWLVICRNGDHEYVAAAFLTEESAHYFIDACRGPVSKLYRVAPRWLINDDIIDMRINHEYKGV